MKNAIKAWTEDFKIHERTENELLEHVEDFFKVCDEHNLRFLAKKCSFYTKKVKWCGRFIDSSGYHLDPRNNGAIRSMGSPTNAA